MPDTMSHQGWLVITGQDEKEARHLAVKDMQFLAFYLHSATTYFHFHLKERFLTQAITHIYCQLLHTVKIYIGVELQKLNQQPVSIVYCKL